MTSHLPGLGTLARLFATCVIGAIVLALARCAPAGYTPAPPTGASTATIALVETVQPTQAAVASESSPSSITARPAEDTATPLARPAVLDVFPLEAGTSWVYSVTVDYETGGQAVHWAGMVTETVTSAERQAGGVILRSETRGHPLLTHQEDAVQAYVGMGDRLFLVSSLVDPAAVIAQNGKGFEGEQILTWPLHLDQRWGEPDMLARGDGFYVWLVEAQEDVATPSGDYSKCYHLSYRSNPDATFAWFCPDIGIVRRQYHHNGSLHDELWELQALRTAS